MTSLSSLVRDRRGTRSAFEVNASASTASTLRNRRRAAAIRAVREHPAGRPVECAERDRDRYGHIVAVFDAPPKGDGASVVIRYKLPRNA